MDTVFKKQGINTPEDNIHPWSIIEIIKIYLLSYVILVTFFSLLILTFNIGHKNVYFIFWNNITFPIILLFLVFYTIKQKYKLDFKKALNLQKPKKLNLFYCSLIGISVAAAAFFIPDMWTSTPIAYKNLGENPQIIIMDMFITGIFIIPLCEEVFWRGFAFPIVRAKFSRFPSIAIISGLFFVSHVHGLWGAWGAVLSVFILSLLVTTIRDITKSTLASIVVHVLYNTTISVLAVVGALFQK